MQKPHYTGTPVKAGLHYGNNHSKLVRFEEKNIFFAFLNSDYPHSVNTTLSCVYIGKGYMIMLAAATVYTYLPWPPWEA
jgi:hypothetical protein